MSRAICSAVFVGAVLVCSVARTQADQGRTAADPVFDVASVKPVDGSSFNGMVASISRMVRQLGSAGSLTARPGHASAD